VRGARRALAGGAAARSASTVCSAVTGDELGASGRGGGRDGGRGLGRRRLRQGRRARDEATPLAAGASCDGASRALADGAAARGTGAVRGAVTGDELGTSSRGGGGDGSRGLGGRCLRQGRGTRDEAAALAAGACGHRTSGTFADGAADRSAVRVCRARAGDELRSSSDARKNGRGRHNGD
jgi:hypothetical protein